MNYKKSRYISFKKLKEDYTLAEIFDFLQAGLQPLYDTSLSPIPCPERHNRCILNIAYIKLIEEGYFDSDNINQLIKKTEKMLAEDPSCKSWKYFVPPYEESSNKEVVFDNPLFNKIKTFLPQDSEPENKELNDVVSLLSKAFFEWENLNEVKKKIDKSHTEKQKRYGPFAKIIKRAIQKFIEKNPEQLPSVKKIRKIIENDHNKMSREFDPDCIIQSILGTNFKIKIKGENKLISKSAFEKRFKRLMQKDFSK